MAGRVVVEHAFIPFMANPWGESTKILFIKLLYSHFCSMCSKAKSYVGAPSKPAALVGEVM